MYLSLGFIITHYFLSVFYERSGIRFHGNVWMNWFGVSFLIYFFYTIIGGLFIKKNPIYTERVQSTSFWVLFIVALYIVFIPFVKGVNPF